MSRMLPPSSERGAAAIEFALILVILLMLLVALIGYGALFWAQQKVTKAAGEGAQAVLQGALRTGSASTAVACEAVREEAAWLDIACAARYESCGWRDASGLVTRCVRVSVSYQVNQWPLLATMRSLANVLSLTSLFPGTLRAQAIVQIPPDKKP